MPRYVTPNLRGDAGRTTVNFHLNSSECFGVSATDPIELSGDFIPQRTTLSASRRREGHLQVDSVCGDPLVRLAYGAGGREAELRQERELLRLLATGLTDQVAANASGCPCAQYGGSWPI